MQTSIPSRKQIKSCRKKLGKVLQVVLLFFRHAKWLLMKLLFESLQTYSHHLLGSMTANYSPTPCVNQCRPLFIYIGISIQKPIYSHLVKTKPVALKIWSYPIFKKQDQNVKVKASTLQADRIKMNISLLTDFVLTAKLCWRQWVAFTFLSFSRSSSFSLWRRFQTRHYGERARCIETKLWARERIHCH